MSGILTMSSAILATVFLDYFSCALSSSRNWNMNLSWQKMKTLMQMSMEYLLNTACTLQWVYHCSWRWSSFNKWLLNKICVCFQGVMSSSYHVCPTNVTFQFDTTFMYLLAVLMFMKLYQVIYQFLYCSPYRTSRFDIQMCQQMLLVSSLVLVSPYSLRLFLFITADHGFGLSFVQ